MKIRSIFGIGALCVGAASIATATFPSVRPCGTIGRFAIYAFDPRTPDDDEVRQGEMLAADGTTIEPLGFVGSGRGLEVAGGLLFGGAGPDDGKIFWSDGTPAGTRLLDPGPARSAQPIGPVSGGALYRVRDGGQVEWWFTDLSTPRIRKVVGGVNAAFELPGGWLVETAESDGSDRHWSFLDRATLALRRLPALPAGIWEAGSIGGARLLSAPENGERTIHISDGAVEGTRALFVADLRGRCSDAGDFALCPVGPDHPWSTVLVSREGTVQPLPLPVPFSMVAAVHRIDGRLFVVGRSPEGYLGLHRVEPDSLGVRTLATNGAAVVPLRSSLLFVTRDLRLIRIGVREGGAVELSGGRAVWPGWWDGWRRTTSDGEAVLARCDFDGAGIEPCRIGTSIERLGDVNPGPDGSWPYATQVAGGRDFFYAYVPAEGWAIRSLPIPPLRTEDRAGPAPPGAP